MTFKTITEQDEDDNLVAQYPALPGCILQDTKREEAVANIKDAINGYLVRHLPEDSYDLGGVVGTIRSSSKKTVVLVDDNYAVMRVRKIGVQLGADLSTFSMFKLLGPEGIGCILGRKDIIAKVREQNYSGGTQVQGAWSVGSIAFARLCACSVGHARSGN